MSIALPILRFRLERGLTQTQLAALCGIAQPNLAAYESGQRQPTLFNLQRLAQALDLNPSKFLEAAPASGLSDRFTLDQVCRALAAGAAPPNAIPQDAWQDLKALFHKKLKALHPNSAGSRPRLSPYAAQRRLKARWGPASLDEISRRMDKFYPQAAP